MEIDLSSGLIDIAKYIGSPNADNRPGDCKAELIVIHNISLPPGIYGGDDIQALFTNSLDETKHPFYEGIAGLKVSAHILIRRDGSIVQFVPFHKRAWHAGKSFYQGRENCNDFSIGIELEGIDTQTYEPFQYKILIDVIKLLLNTYATLNIERIVGHCDIAPGRKTDPGPAFNWQYLRDQLTSATDAV